MTVIHFSILMSYFIKKTRAEINTFFVSLIHFNNQLYLQYINLVAELIHIFLNGFLVGKPVFNHRDPFQQLRQRLIAKPVFLFYCLLHTK